MRRVRSGSLPAAALACFCFGLPDAARCGASQQHAEHGVSDFASSLRRVVRAAREQFAPLMSFRVDIRPGRMSWYEAKLSLPGASTCRIYEHPQWVYRCEWQSKPEAGMANEYAGLVRRVEAALGPEWVVTRRRNTTRFEPRNGRSGGVEVLRAETLQLVIHTPARAGEAHGPPE